MNKKPVVNQPVVGQKENFITKTERLKAQKDTYKGILWDDFITIIERYGFVIQEKKFTEGDFDEDEIEVIYIHPKKYVTLYANTVNTKKVDNCNVIGFIYANSLADAKNVSPYGSFDRIKENMLYFDLTYEYGIIEQLEAISENYTFVEKWPQLPTFFWFVTYMEQRKFTMEHDDGVEISKTKLKKAVMNAKRNKQKYSDEKEITIYDIVGMVD